MGEVPARLVGVDPAALAWALEVAGGDWRRVVRRGDGVSVAAEATTHRVELAAAAPRRRAAARPAAPAPPDPMATGGWTFTAHALLRMAERGVDAEEVLDALAHPAATWPAPPPHRRDGGEMNAMRGSVFVGYHPASRRITHVHRNAWRDPKRTSRAKRTT